LYAGAIKVHPLYIAIVGEVELLGLAGLVNNYDKYTKNEGLVNLYHGLNGVCIDLSLIYCKKA
jgi:hypothetical protein